MPYGRESGALHPWTPSQLACYTVLAPTYSELDCNSARSPGIEGNLELVGADTANYLHDMPVAAGWLATRLVALQGQTRAWRQIG